VVETEGLKVAGIPVASGIPGHEPEYQCHTAFVPKLPPVIPNVVF
jgi:hypothetical protein